MRPLVISVLLVTALGCGANAVKPCVPEGEHDFFLVLDGDFAGLSGTMDFAADHSVVLQMEARPERLCLPESLRDDRDQPIGVCQLFWSCVEPQCAKCKPWHLSLMYAPAADDVMPQGGLTGLDGGFEGGTWSAARRAP